MSELQAHRFLFVVARGDAFGGSSLHVMDMASRLGDDGHRVRILVGGDASMETPRRFAAEGLDFVCLPDLSRKISPIKDARALLSIRAAVRDFSPDLISLHAAKAGALGRLAGFGMGVPILYTPHCWSFVDGFPKARLYRWLEKCLAPLAARIVTVSEDERRFGLEKAVGTGERTLTIHNGIQDRVDPVGSGTEESKERDAPSIVMVGRFETQKDQRLLIEALGRIRDLSWRLTLVGDGPLRSDCVDAAERLGIAERVEFAGYSNRVAEDIRRHDVFALISHWEGFPRSILEAMSAGLPVIASDVGGCREAVIDGSTGRLVGGDDVANLEGALREMITDRDRARAMGRRGRERFAARFTLERMYADYVDLYQQVISEHGGRSRFRSPPPLPPRASAPHSEPSAGALGEGSLSRDPAHFSES